MLFWKLSDTSSGFYVISQHQQSDIFCPQTHNILRARKSQKLFKFLKNFESIILFQKGKQYFEMFVLIIFFLNIVFEMIGKFYEYFIF